MEIITFSLLFILGSAILDMNHNGSFMYAEIPFMFYLFYKYYIGDFYFYSYGTSIKCENNYGLLESFSFLDILLFYSRVYG